MDAALIIAAIEGAIKIASQAIQLGQDVEPFAKAIYDNLTGKKVLTEADIDALEIEIDRLSDELQTPLPPE